jgi:hypothetical protein
VRELRHISHGVAFGIETQKDNRGPSRVMAASTRRHDNDA